MRKYATFFLLATLLLCLTPFKALANSAAPATFTYLSGPPEQVALKIIGTMLLIVLLEAIILWKMLAVEFRRALWISFVANIFTTIIGLIILAIPGLLLIISIALIMICVGQRDRIPGYVIWIIVVTLLASPFLMIFGFMPFGGLAMHYIWKAFIFPASVVSCFGLTVFVEGDTVRRHLRRDNIWNAVLVGNVITYILLIIMSVNSYVPAGSSRHATMSRATGTLRSIGSSQLAYQGTNNDKEYGSFNALKDDLYIARGHTQSNMIENYSLSWSVINVSTAMSEGISFGTMNSFTIVAFPDDPRPGYLKTFCVTDDQVVRVYNPESGNAFEYYTSWDPIL